MKKKFYLKICSLMVLLVSFQHATSQSNANYDDLTLSPNSYWNGSNNSGGFNDAGYFFENTYSDYGGGMYAWYGFAYSNMRDTLTSGYTNQFSSITGKGALNSANYAVSYVNYDWTNNYQLHPNTIRFSTPSTISGFYATNNTYAYFSMLNGDGNLAKKFGGVSGNDADWLKLQVKAYRNGTMIDTVNCFLADFRFANNAQDYILKSWKWVDLSVFGNVDSLSFGLTSSDNGMYGMNTPAYFCMDNFNGLNPNLGIRNINTNENLFQIYPNPFTEKLQISSKNSNEIQEVQIFDIQGNEILKISNVKQELTLNLAELHSGIYFVKISVSDCIFYQKIIKK
ncbi:MAG: DUF4465 domain-containing protein [Bacteroidota bacterium]